MHDRHPEPERRLARSPPRNKHGQPEHGGVDLPFVHGVALLPGASSLICSCASVVVGAFGETHQFARVPVQLGHPLRAEFGQQRGADRGRGRRVAVADAGRQRKTFPTLVDRQVQHPGTVQHRDLHQLPAQHLGVLAGAVELPDLVEPGQERAAQFHGPPARAGTRRPVRRTRPPSSSAKHRLDTDDLARPSSRAISVSVRVWPRRSASRSRMRMARVTAGVLPGPRSGSVLWSTFARGVVLLRLADRLPVRSISRTRRYRPG